MKILFLSVDNPSFVARDRVILSNNFDTSYIQYSNKTKPAFLHLFRLIQSTDILFLWFASLNFILPVLLAKVFSKKIIIVSGGYDVANLEELKYGSCNSLLKRYFVKNLLKSAHKILAVSKSNMQEVINNCKIQKDKIKLIYHGFKLQKKIDFNSKENRIITIGFINKDSFKRKGIDRFIELAKFLPDIPFHLVGKCELQLELPANVFLEGYVDDDKLLNLFKQSKIYIQFSRHEAFGCSLAESMQRGCIPVISGNYSLPEVAGDAGLVINDFSDFTEIAIKIRSIFDNYSPEQAQKSADHINYTFPFENREKGLIEVVMDINNE